MYPAVDKAEKYWSENISTFSLAQSFSVVAPEYMASQQYGVAVDSSGNFLVYSSTADGHSTGTPGWSCTTDIITTDAPDVSYLLGDCFQGGSSMGFTAWKIPASVGNDYATLGEENYLYAAHSLGVGSPGFEVHGIWSHAKRVIQLNIFEKARAFLSWWEE